MIGSGIYAGKVEKTLRSFFNQHSPPEGLNFALFATWLGRGDSGNKALGELEEQMLSKTPNLQILKPYFMCHGKTALLRRGHPSETDLKKACEWARELRDHNK